MHHGDHYILHPRLGQRQRIGVNSIAGIELHHRCLLTYTGHVKQLCEGEPFPGVFIYRPARNTVKIADLHLALQLDEFLPIPSEFLVNQAIDGKRPVAVIERRDIRNGIHPEAAFRSTSNGWR
ncbi:hypothetical protein D3C73_1282470 [compost metagenome]